MKVSPLSHGTGVPAQSDSSLGRTADSSKLSRAKAIASGQTPSEQTNTGDPQADRAKATIKMKTQHSINRHEDTVGSVAVEDQENIVNTVSSEQSPILDNSEQVKGKEETKPIDPQVAAIIKAKRALQVKERELEQREEAIKAQTPAGNDDLIAKLKSNPLSVLQEAGVSYEQLTEAILANQSGLTPEIQSLKSEIKALKEDLNSQFLTRDQQAEQQVLADLKREALQLSSEGDQYEAIRESKAQQKVVDLIHGTWKSTGEVMDVTEACELVENQLVEDALGFARIKKVQSRLMPAQTEVQTAQIPAPQKANTKVMRTLTNRDNAAPITDRRTRAIAAAEGRFKR